MKTLQLAIDLDLPLDACTQTFARIKRKVKGLYTAHAAGQSRCVEEAEYDHAYRRALDDVLKVLEDV